MLRICSLTPDVIVLLFCVPMTAFLSKYGLSKIRWRKAHKSGGLHSSSRTRRNGGLCILEPQALKPQPSRARRMMGAVFQEHLAALRCAPRHPQKFHRIHVTVNIWPNNMHYWAHTYNGKQRHCWNSAISRICNARTWNISTV